ncbi:MAG: tyrosyl-tRNA synthetase [Bathelium mastoideum]|nr:MAG: tyrosyl-tRNA synthetase [Bathelium mastoideum]
MAHFWMYLHGYPTISLIGGFTARIGDPTGRTTARDVQSSSALGDNTNRMISQVHQLWTSFKEYAKRHGYVGSNTPEQSKVLNNAEWGRELSLEQFLRELGTGVRLGAMLSRDTVKTRMEKGDGMSFAEFTYPLLQAYDFKHLYEKKHVQLQIGGSDQYGNIVAGIAAIRYSAVTSPEPDEPTKMNIDDPLNIPYGFTVPLLTTSSGAKFGKSAGNAIWLDPTRTSPFDLYGFLLSTPDADVCRLLRLLTLLPLPAIATAQERHASNPSARHAQHLLANECVTLIHGSEAATMVQRQHAQLFRGRPVAESGARTVVREGTEADADARTDPAGSLAGLKPTAVLQRAAVVARPLAHVLAEAGIVESRKEGARLIAAGGIYLGCVGEVDEVEKVGLDFRKMESGREDVVVEGDLVGGRMLVVRRGKRKIIAVKVVEKGEGGKDGEDVGLVRKGGSGGESGR